MNAEDDRALARALARAHGAGCPPATAWQEHLESGTPLDDDLAAHLAGCPACQAELELARAFFAPDPAELAACGEEIAAIAARLAARRTSTPAAVGGAGGEPAEVRPTVVPFPAARARAAAPPRRLRAWALAATVLLAAGFGWIALERRGIDDRLPEPPAAGVVRGGEVDLVAPAGELVEPPTTLRWTPVAGAADYAVEILAVDDTPLWSARTAASPLELPAAVRAALRDDVLWRWRVTALDAAGHEIAHSAPVAFRHRGR